MGAEGETLELEKFANKWLGSNHKIKSMDSVESCWFSTVKYSNFKGTKNINNDIPPHIDVKIQRYEKRNEPGAEKTWECEIYDENYEPLFLKTDNYNNETNITPATLIPKRTRSLVKCIITPMIWVVSGKINVSWQLVQAIVQTPVAVASGRCVIPMDANTKKRLTEQKYEKQEHTEKDEIKQFTTVNATLLDSDSDCDSDSDEDEELINKTQQPVVVPISTTLLNEHEDEEEEKEVEQNVKATKKPITKVTKSKK